MSLEPQALSRAHRHPQQLCKRQPPTRHRHTDQVSGDTYQLYTYQLHQWGGGREGEKKGTTEWFTAWNNLHLAQQKRTTLGIRKIRALKSWIIKRLDWKLADVTVATWWKFMTLQKCYFFSVSQYSSRDPSAKVIVQKFSLLLYKSRCLHVHLTSACCLRAANRIDVLKIGVLRAPGTCRVGGVSEVKINPCDCNTCSHPSTEIRFNWGSCLSSCSSYLHLLQNKIDW